MLKRAFGAFAWLLKFTSRSLCVRIWALLWTISANWMIVELAIVHASDWSSVIMPAVAIEVCILCGAYTVGITLVKIPNCIVVIHHMSIQPCLWHRCEIAFSTLTPLTVVVAFTQVFVHPRLYHRYIITLGTFQNWTLMVLLPMEFQLLLMGENFITLPAIRL